MTEPRTKTQRGDIVAQHADPETGELIPFHLHDAAFITPAGQGRPHSKKDRRHPVFMLVDAANAMAKLELTGQEARIFWIIVSRINPSTGECRVKATEIAAELDVSPAAVSQVTGRLRQRRIILPNGVSTWTINPWIAAYGEAVEWEKATPTVPQPIWSRA